MASSTGGARVDGNEGISNRGGHDPGERTGEVDRFAHPRQVMAYLGLVPTENTSSDKRRQGQITKCGNAHARWLLVECAQHYAAPPKVSKELSRRQQGQPREVLAISWRAQNRLHGRFARLSARRLQRNKALVAIARELCGFIWELLRTQSCYQTQRCFDHHDLHARAEQTGDWCEKPVGLRQ